MRMVIQYLKMLYHHSLFYYCKRMAWAVSIGTLFENAKLIFPLWAVETASAAIFIISGTAGLIAVKSRLLLHEQFKSPLLALCEIHSGCTSFPAGIKKRRYFLPKRG